LTTESEPERRINQAGGTSALGIWLRAGLGVAGLCGLVFLVSTAGAAAVYAAMREAIVWLPLLIALELGRIVCESLACYLAFGPLAHRIPRATLFRANLIGLAMSHFAPAPRLVNETVKASLIAPYSGVPAAAAVGFTLQAATLVSVGLFSLPCALAIYVLDGASVWFWAVLIHCVVLVTTGIVLRAATRADGPGRWLAKKFPRISPGTASFSEHARTVSLWAPGPTAALTGNRLFQVLELAVAAHAVGIDAGVAHAFAVQGVNLVASAVGVLVPGGLGTTDGAFALSAEMLGTTIDRATSLALLIRCNQLVWLLIGSVTLFVGRTRRMATAAGRN